ncbi:MAG: hypothetical protein LBI04_09375 [Treponema sp.]|jgi:opacity protein-like surface antigen|nr:hypothetical protein [Treponema sp.]
MKKSISILVLLALVAGGAFALDMSAGGGLLFDLSGNNGVADGDLYMGTRILSIGGYGFFDATFVEVDVSFAYGMLTYVYDFGPLGDGSDDAGSALQLGFSLLGKYPIDLGGFTLFPLLGVNYNLVLSASDQDGNDMDDAGDMSQLGFLAGLGFDLPLSDALYLRAEAMFNLRLPMKIFDDLDSDNTTFGMGPRIKVGVGYKF